MTDIKSSADQELTAEQIKQQKQDKFRKNIRIVALVIAAYYFISAGFSWYEEHQELKTALYQEQVVIEKLIDLKNVLTTANQIYGSTLELNEADNLLVDKTAAVKASLILDANQNFSGLEIELAYENSISAAQHKAILGMLAVLENTQNTQTVDQIATTLGFKPQLEDLTFAEGSFGTKHKIYELHFVDSQPRVVKLKVYKPET